MPIIPEQQDLAKSFEYMDDQSDDESDTEMIEQELFDGNSELPSGVTSSANNEIGNQVMMGNLVVQPTEPNLAGSVFVESTVEEISDFSVPPTPFASNQVLQESVLFMPMVADEQAGVSQLTMSTNYNVYEADGQYYFVAQT